MKKIIIIILIIEIVNLVLVVLSNYYCDKDFKDMIEVDTIYNKILIDSIQLNITKVDSTIIEYNKIMNYEMDKANNLSNDSAVLLFRELLQGK